MIKLMKRLFSLSLFCILLTFSLFACRNKEKDSQDQSKEQDFSQLSKAYFASGCFWCVEAVFESVKGVEEVISGYSGGEKPNPTYEEVSRGATKHAETVMVIYDPNQIDFKALIEVFYASHDPTSVNRQGPDRGTQYRSIAFYQNEKEKQQIENYIQKLEQSGEYQRPIATEVMQFEKFWEAEAYHQDFEHRNPDHPYIQNVSIPRLRAFKAKMPQVLK